MRKFLCFICTCIGIVGIAIADTININWLNEDGTTYDTSTCTVGGTLNLPTEPTKRGYTFQGWRSRWYDLSTLDTGTNGTYSDMSDGGWKVVFPYGTLYGTRLCSVTTAGGFGARGNPDETSAGTGCWCRATGFTPTGEDVIYEAYNTHWVYTDWYSACTTRCTCSYVANNNSFRERLFN